MNHKQTNRYARHLTLPEIGVKGQEKLLQSKILIIGAGGLGCPALLYLTAAGVGTIGIVDNDIVSINDLQRQILYDTTSLGQLKVSAAAERLTALNPEISIQTDQGHYRKSRSFLSGVR
jgi:molybdopterin/thiamine biosynthesis adenylyltransferase